MSKLKVEIKDLKESPYILELNEIPSRLDLTECEPYEFKGKITGSIEFRLVGNDVLAEGKIKSTCETFCSRCLENIKVEHTSDFNVVYIIKDEFTTENLEEEVSPDGMVECPYDGEVIFPANEIRETILIDMPDIPLCSDQCKGICQYCGANLNKEECQCDKAKIDEENMPDWKKKLKDINFEK